MVRTIFRNLLSNAIKFTHNGGEIIIDSSLNNDLIACSVTDNGIGISPENISKLFKVDSTIRKKGTSNERGTGLGLALCKEFVEKNGGNISVESEPEKGSKFVFTLPVK
jgi:signal transduction histidine kinase